MKFNRKILVLFFICAVSAALIYFANIWRSDDECNKITVTGNKTISTEQILQYAHLKPDTIVNLNETELNLIHDRIKKHPEVKKVSISVEPPSELIIDIIERKPAAVVNTGTGLMLLDEDMELSELRNAEMMYDLPVISGVIEHSTKKPDKLKYKTALLILKTAYAESRNLYNLISEISFIDSTRILMYSNSNNLPFYLALQGSRADEEYRAEMSEALKVFKHFHNTVSPEECSKYKFIDLRYKNKVIANFQNNTDEPTQKEN